MCYFGSKVNVCTEAFNIVIQWQYDAILLDQQQLFFISWMHYISFINCLQHILTCYVFSECHSISSRTSLYPDSKQSQLDEFYVGFFFIIYGIQQLKKTPSQVYRQLEILPYDTLPPSRMIHASIKPQHVHYATLGGVRNVSFIGGLKQKTQESSVTMHIAANSMQNRYLNINQRHMMGPLYD